jgi:hypothetical protein
MLSLRAINVRDIWDKSEAMSVYISLPMTIK